MSRTDKWLGSTWIGLLLIVLLLGIFFRFANLDQKVYWYDEAHTSLRISGYTLNEFVEQAFDGNVILSGELQQYQRPSTKSALDTIVGLAQEEPQLPPLYFLLARFWAQLFGSLVAVVRSLSAVFGLLMLPAMYWLCWELLPQRLRR